MTTGDGTWHSRDSEMSAIGCALLKPATLEEMRSVVSPDDFHGLRTRQAWEAICSMYAAGQPVDSLLLYDRLRAAHGEYPVEILADALESVPTLVHAVNYASGVDGFARKRKVRSVLVGALDALASAMPDDCRELATSVRMELGAAYEDQAQGKGLLSAHDALDDAFKSIEDTLRNGKPAGVQWGLAALDATIVGLMDKTLTVVGARPSMGKSSLVKRAVIHNALAGKRVAVFPIEDGRQRFILRCLSEMAKIPFSCMIDGSLSSEDFDRILSASEKLSATAMVCDDANKTTPAYIRSELHRLAKSGKIDLVVVDYLQRMTPDRRADSKHLEIGEMCGQMKDAAKEFDCPVILLSQLNRSLEGRANKRPQMSDLRESGTIEEAADRVVFLYRDEYYNEQTKDPGVAELLVAKDRDGKVGTVRVGFEGVYTRFYDLSDGGVKW